MKTNPEFDRFTGFMDKLAKVPHSELKAELDKELEAKLERRAAKAAKALKGHIHFSGTDQPSPAVKAFNEVMKKQRLRKVN
jgi:hypothetical protein